MKLTLLILGLLLTSPTWGMETEVTRKPAAFSHEEIMAGGGETSYDLFTVAVQDEHLGEVPQDESSDFFDP